MDAWGGGQVRPGWIASRTFTHRTLTHDWYFIDACQLVKSIGLFKNLFFLPCVPG